jgi:hypothetical protein
MQIIIDPRYIDSLACELTALNLEVEQSRTFLGEAVCAHETSELFQKAVAQLADYQEKREQMVDRVREIAQRFGIWCKESGELVLLGCEWHIKLRDQEITILVCATAEGSGVAPSGI